MENPRQAWNDNTVRDEKLPWIVAIWRRDFSLCIGFILVFLLPLCYALNIVFVDSTVEMTMLPGVTLLRGMTSLQQCCLKLFVKPSTNNYKDAWASFLFIWD